MTKVFIPPERIVRNQYKMKMILIGDSSVGKTSIMKRIVTNEFMKHSLATIGVDYMMKTYVFDDFDVACMICDTSGQERFRSLVQSFYRQIDVAFMVYDVTNKDSFDHIIEWQVEIEKNSNSSRIIIILVGNKIDLLKKRVISKQDGVLKAIYHNWLFIETSAESGENIKECMAIALEQYRDMIHQQRKDDQRYNERIKLQESRRNKKSVCC
jgi:small GTP-binding protein